MTSEKKHRKIQRLQLWFPSRSPIFLPCAFSLNSFWLSPAVRLKSRKNFYMFICLQKSRMRFEPAFCQMHSASSHVHPKIIKVKIYYILFCARIQDIKAKITSKRCCRFALKKAFARACGHAWALYPARQTKTRRKHLRVQCVKPANYKS